MKDKRLVKIHQTIAFLRSVIVSGEPMTGSVENAIIEAEKSIESVNKDLKSE